jgi:archaellum component FlaF (FlaF/FlaG flagellin family)
MTRIKSAGMAIGYKFKVTSFKASSSDARVVVENTGIAPIYADAWVAVNGVRSSSSLKGLLPGQSREFSVPSGGSSPDLTIVCDRLVSGQSIEFEADL